MDPTQRTESAVAISEFIKQYTSDSSVRIISYYFDNSNELGSEWVLMEHAPGITLYKAWRKLPWTAKAAIVKQLAIHQAQLFKQEFHKIGNLYRRAISLWWISWPSLAHEGEMEVVRVTSHQESNLLEKLPVPESIAADLSELSRVVVGLRPGLGASIKVPRANELPAADSQNHQN